MDELFDFEDTPEIEKFEDWSFQNYDYRVAIPTYKRYECLKNKTLKVLIDGGVDFDKIDIFVADSSEKEKYEQILSLGTYSKIIIGQKGLKEQRNFIHDYYVENQLIVSMDDDIEKMEFFVDEKTLKNIEDLNKLFCYGFYVAENSGVNFWGVYPVSNPYFMKQSIALGLRFINGTFFAFKNGKHLKVKIDEKDDFERTIKAYLHDGSVMRLDFVTYESKEFSEKGGMQSDYLNRDELAKTSAEYLMREYSNLCKINNARKNRCEIKLVEQRPEYKASSKKRISWS